MRLKTMGLALVACLAVTAIVASSAQANWKIGTEPKTTNETQEGGSELTTSETVELEKHTGELKLTGTVGTIAVTLTAENVRCASGKSCTIDPDAAGPPVFTNHSTGTLEFTGVTVDISGVEPGVCTANNGTVVTAPLTDEVIHDPSNPAGPIFDKFFPESGNTFVTITFGGSKCPLNEASAAVTGTVTGESVHTNESGALVQNKTGTLVEDQILVFGKAQQETGGGSLKLAKNAAYLDGQVLNRLSGANAGKTFGAME
jgi:hypothetical protein